MNPMLLVVATLTVLCQARKQISDDRLSCSSVHQMGVKDLRQYLTTRNLDCKACIEKSEYISKVLEICDASPVRHPSEETLLVDEARQPSGCAILVGMLGIAVVPLVFMSRLLKVGNASTASSGSQTERRTTISSNANAAEATCRICLCSSCEDSDELFQPCRCSGTMQFVHKSCLNTWRLMGDNPRWYYECPNCHYRYNLRRLPLADFVASPGTRTCTAILLLILPIWLFTYVAKFLLGHLFYPKLVWLQSLFSGSVLLGLLVHSILGCSYLGCQTTLWINLWSPLSSVWQAFWNSSEVVSPGMVKNTIAHLIIVLARQGLLEGGMILYMCVSKMAQALLRKMESVILGQVLEFAESPNHACSNNCQHADIHNLNRPDDVCKEEDDEDDEEEWKTRVILQRATVTACA